MWGDRGRPEIIGEVEEITTYLLKEWETHSASYTGVFDPKAGAVISIAVAIATAYFTGGASLGMASAQATFATQGITGLATKMMAVGVNHMISNLCAHSMLSVMKGGSLKDAAKDVFSNAGLRQMAVEVATAGLLDVAGLDIVLPQQAGIGAVIQQEVAKAVVKTAVDATIGGQKVGDALKANVINGAAKVGAKQIGQAYKGEKPTLNYFEHKTAHGLLGALTGLALTGNTKGMLGGAVGGVVSEVVAEEIMGNVNAKVAAIYEKAATEGTTLTPEAFQAQYDEAVHTDFASGMGKLAAGFAALATNQDVNVAAHVAANAVENNFIPAAIMVGALAYEAYDIYQTYQNEGAEAAAKQLGFTVGTAVIGGIAVKGAFIMGKVAFRTAGEAIAHYKQAHPVFAKFYDVAAAACAKGVNAYKKLDAKLDATVGNVVNKVLPKKAPTAAPKGITTQDYNAPEAAYTLRVDPHTNQGPMSIDTSQFKNPQYFTKQGAPRDHKQFWQMWEQKYPGMLSKANIQNTQNGKAPKVDAHWIQHFPEHQHFMGQKLEHHHLDHGHLAIPLPKELHRLGGNFSVWHQ